LPKVGYNDSFFSLWEYYGFSIYNYFYDDNDMFYALWTEPLFFVPGGVWSGHFANVGYAGFFWSSMVGDDDGGYGAYMAFFDIYNGGSSTSYDSGRNFGQSVRCIARPVDHPTDSDGGGGDVYQ
jgi:hypothetical protein